MADIRDDKSARGTPNTVRPTIGLGCLTRPVVPPVEPDTRPAGDRTTVVVPECSPLRNLARVPMGEVARGYARVASKELLASVCAACGSVFGISDADVAELLRDLATEKAGPG